MRLPCAHTPRQKVAQIHRRIANNIPLSHCQVMLSKSAHVVVTTRSNACTGALGPVVPRRTAPLTISMHMSRCGSMAPSAVLTVNLFSMSCSCHEFSVPLKKLLVDELYAHDCLNSEFKELRKQWRKAKKEEAEVRSLSATRHGSQDPAQHHIPLEPMSDAVYQSYHLRSHLDSAYPGVVGFATNPSAPAQGQTRAGQAQAQILHSAVYGTFHFRGI
jgi:hypothetical protein